MIHIIKTEFWKLKRYHILLVGFIGMALPSILSVFTQAVTIDEAKIPNFDFAALFNSSIWNSVTIFMPIIFTLIGGYIINREYSDDTLKNILSVPISFRHLLFGKLIALGLLSILFGLYNFVITLIVGVISGVHGLSAYIIIKSLLQMLGISICTYIAILPIIALTSKMPSIFTGGVIVSFIIGYSSMFIKSTLLRSLYPILAGFTVINFDLGIYMNTSEPGIFLLSFISLATMLIVAIIIVMASNPPQMASKDKKHKKSDIFLRKGQKSR